MTEMILIVDDDITHQMIVTSLLKKMGYKTSYASNGKDALHYLEKKNRPMVDLVLLDLHMPNMSGLEVLTIIKQKYDDLPVIMLTASEDVKDVVKAMKIGEVDFLNKPIENEHLKISIKNTLRISSLSKEVSSLKRKEKKSTRFENIIGYDGDLAKTVNIARKAAYSDIPVLINGEVGTGKALLAAAIHGESKRAGQAFIEINCASIPNERLEQELFGSDNFKGKFQEAIGGTISLYEVSELTPSAQARLLDILKNNEKDNMNDNKSRSSDVRIVATSSKKLANEVRLGNFRDDLYFRLNVLNIDVIPLRERAEDILKLIRHFMDSCSISENLPRMSLSKQAEEFLISYEWKGNVRQLNNVIHRAMLLTNKYILEVQDFTYAISNIDGESGGVENNRPSAYNISMLSAKGKLKKFDNIEQEAIIIALKYHNNNVTQAAKSLGMAKSTFYKKMRNIQD